MKFSKRGNWICQRTPTENLGSLILPSKIDVVTDVLLRTFCFPKNIHQIISSRIFVCKQFLKNSRHTKQWTMKKWIVFKFQSLIILQWWKNALVIVMMEFVWKSVICYCSARVSFFRNFWEPLSLPLLWFLWIDNTGEGIGGISGILDLNPETHICSQFDYFLQTLRIYGKISIKDLSSHVDTCMKKFK